MSNFETLTVEEVAMRERNDGTGEFPVVIISGISINTSESGTVSFNKRRVSLPANGFSLQEVKNRFPTGMTLEGYKIEKYEVDPYEWETPDGEVRMDNVRYRLKRITQSPEQTTALKAVNSMENHVFADSPRQNDLQPQL